MVAGQKRNVVNSGYQGNWPELASKNGTYGDSGGASRFFYCFRASTSEKNTGLGEGEINDHPTVKPLRLCEYLAKMLLPPKRDTPRRILCPFSGSGSEMIGCIVAGWDEVVGIEKDARFVAIAEKRLYAMEKSLAKKSKNSKKADKEESLFDE